MEPTYWEFQDFMNVRRPLWQICLAFRILRKLVAVPDRSSALGIGTASLKNLS